jgi:integrase
MIPFNPAADVAKAKPAEREMKCMTETQGKRFLAAGEKQGLYPLFVTALGTGMRQGELLGLQWSDIDIEKGTLEVKRSLGWLRKDNGPNEPKSVEPLLKEPKSKAGKRTIALPSFVLRALTDHRTAMFKAGRITAPVFCTRTGKHIDKKNVLRSFRNVVEKTNAAEQELATKENRQPDVIPEEIRFHDLRHTHASCLIAAGHSIKAVSRRLGHGSVEVTLRVYSHLMPNDDAKLANGVEAMFG